MLSAIEYCIYMVLCKINIIIIIINQLFYYWVMVTPHVAVHLSLAYIKKEIFMLMYGEWISTKFLKLFLIFSCRCPKQNIYHAPKTVSKTFSVC